ncbi:putative metalloprotease with chaperone activity (RNAse H/HSP70 fold) [Pseudoloma neurophilia]|uniref:N(6)-L-threonylcarbamoyladenine synthase n=1 Tax=Pseudoloma neurophilia TaxID=146866 RepID=A0A0R0M454_9MICR|nr:putative metalloprotease with chaperone activity (RNAse H/HSP70 fold) [Pseudoloma neurophilia]
MKVIGIESSANKLGIALIENGNIIFNARRTHITAPGLGFIPSETAMHHYKNAVPLLKELVKTTGVKLKDIDLITFTRGPGMAGPLQVGALVARTLSVFLNKPIVPVNHCIAHIEMGIEYCKAKNPIILYASGGNTQIIAYCSSGYKIIGETLDIAVGNCLDRFARYAKISNDPSPGYNLEQLAKKSKVYKKIPYVVKGMDMSLAGIVPYIEQKYPDPDQETVESLCYSLQETIFAALVEVTERAMALQNSKEVLICGGVGCNERLQQMMQIMCQERNSIVHSMNDSYCVDNGAMIAHTGTIMYKSGLRFTLKDTDVTQRWRTDKVDVTWK